MGALDNIMDSLSSTKTNSTIELFKGFTPKAQRLLENIHKKFSLYKINEQTGEYIPTDLFVMLTTKGNQVIDAIAGGGKTTALIFKLLFDLENGEISHELINDKGFSIPTVDKTWVCTYLKSGAEELESAFKNKQVEYHSTPTDNIIFSTLDAEFKRCLNAMGVETNLGKENVIFSLFKNAVKYTKFSDESYKPENMAEDDYRQLYTLVNMWRSRLDKANLNLRNLGNNNSNITTEELNELCTRFSHLKSSNNVMDFIDLCELLYKYLYITPNPAIQDFVANRYDNIYIDEFQDTSQLAYAILKFYARDSLSKVKERDIEICRQYHSEIRRTNTKIVFVGDVSQCIYTFRGSDSHILSNLALIDFKPTSTKLSVNWRCPSNILNPIVPSIHKNYDSALQQINAAKSGGEFYAYHFDNLSRMSEYLFKCVCEDVEKGKKVAILCRTNYDGALPAFMFEKGKKFSYSISSQSMTLSTAIPKKILGFASIFTEKYSKTIFDSLSLMLDKKTAWEEMKQLQAAYEISKKDSENFVWDGSLDDIAYSIPSLKNFIEELRQRGNNLDTLHWVYVTLIDNLKLSNSRYSNLLLAYAQIVLEMIEDYMACLQDKYYICLNGNYYTLDGREKRLACRQRVAAQDIDLTTVTSTYGEIKQSAEGNFFVPVVDDSLVFDDNATLVKIYADCGDIYDFISNLETLSENIESHIKSKYFDVIITTVHDFKGKEADCVYIWNDSEGVFPSLKTNTLVSQAEAIMEERRLHYVACTRAKEKEMILALRGKEGMFTQEMPIYFSYPPKK